VECLLADQAELARLAPSTRWGKRRAGRKARVGSWGIPSRTGWRAWRSIRSHLGRRFPQWDALGGPRSRGVGSLTRCFDSLAWERSRSKWERFCLRSSVVKLPLTCRSSGTAGFRRRWLGVSILFWVFHKAVTGTTVQPTSMGALPLMSMQVNGGPHYRVAAGTIGGPTTAQPQSWRRASPDSAASVSPPGREEVEPEPLAWPGSRATCAKRREDPLARV
jgi:hypothetical protein